jgi:hypothetical protein
MPVGAPDYPDPEETAAAQTASNKETAIAQYGLAATNQFTPTGSLTYQQIGTWEDGTPRYRATQTLSEDQQGLLDSSEQLGQTMLNTGNQQATAVQDLLSQPLDLSNSATEDYLFDLGSQQLDPYYDQEQEQMVTQLANQGIMPGSEAYTNAMSDFNDYKNDAYNELLLTGHQTAVNDMTLERSQPLNELNAMMSGSQVAPPPQNYAQTPQPGVNPTDVAGITNAAYQAEMAQYSAMMGGLFSLGSAAVGGWAMSDERLKTDIVRVGETPGGIGIYTFRWKDTGNPDIGFIAQDVERIAPHAVKEVNGVKMVNYPAAAEYR